MQDFSLGTAQQQLDMLQQQIAVFEATLGAPTTTPSLGIPTTLLMYSENSVTLFPTLSFTYVSNSMTQSTRIFMGEKLNGHNYFSWYQSVKMILEGRHKFGFLSREIPHPQPGDP